MKSFLNRSAPIDRIFLLIIISVWIVVHSLLFSHYGLRFFVDSEAYIREADLLITKGEFSDTRYIFYSSTIFLIALCRLFFPDGILLFIIIQCILSGIAAIALYKSSLCIFRSKFAGLFSALFFLLWMDNIHWNTVVMTESLLASTVCFVIFCLSRFEGSTKDYAWLLVLSVISLLIRPTGVIVIVGVVLFVTTHYWIGLKGKPVIKLSLVTGLLAISIICATIMFEHWDFSRQYEQGNIITYADVIDKKNDSYDAQYLRINSDHIDLAEPSTTPIIKVIHFISYNPVHAVKTGGLKVWYLISFVRPYYSDLHNLFSISWVVFIYWLFYVGLKKAFDRRLIFFVVTVIFVNCALIFISSVDWDNRFYIPMEPGIVLLAGGGMAYFLEKKWRRHLTSIDNHDH